MGKSRCRARKTACQTGKKGAAQIKVSDVRFAPSADISAVLPTPGEAQLLRGRHATSPPETSASRHGHCRAADAAATGRRADLSLAPGADCRGVCRGRRRRHHGAADRAVAFRSARAILLDDNRPGAGGNIGTEAVVNAPPDGHTLLLATLPNAVNATLYDKLNFNFI